MNAGLKTKIVLIVTGVLLFTMGAIIASSGYVFTKEYTRALESWSLTIGRELQLDLERVLKLTFGINVEDLVGFDEECQDIVRTYKGIHYAMLVGREGNVIAHSDRTKVGQTVTDPAVLGALGSHAEVVTAHREEGIKDYSAILPVFNPSGAYMASVVVNFPAALITDKARKMVAFDLGVGLLFLVSGVVVLLVTLSAFVTRPLAQLIGTIEQIRGSGTHVVHRVPISSRDEIGQLATAFNAMMEDLHNTTVSKEELEATVAERTRALREAQDELVRKERLAVLGQVVGSVGHELRNPLGVMSNAVYFLHATLPEADATTREYLDIIKDEIAVAERIVADLLDAVRTKPPRPGTVDIAALITECLHKCTIPERVTVRLEIPATLAPAWGDPLQMQQVFQNLIVNAVDAMPAGGHLDIGAEHDQEAALLRVRVQDTGVGITPEHMRQLFQPLFTTKARGIGLGLVVVKNLTQANGGSVAVDSEAGQGTTFTVTLPVCSETAAMHWDL